MGRVSAETIAKLNAFIESLPEEARSKCALCNETLTHIVKKAEAETGAGTATVCRAIAESVNEGAVENDKVNMAQLRNRVVNQERHSICVNHANKSNPEFQPNDQPKQNGTMKKHPSKKEVDPAREYVRELDTVSDEFLAAFDQMVNAIQNAREGGWRESKMADCHNKDEKRHQKHPPKKEVDPARGWLFTAFYR